MQYIVDTLEVKTTTTGKKYALTNLKDETGAVYEKVSIWSDFPNFESITFGSSVAGKVVTNDKGYKNLKNEITYATGRFKPSGMAGMMEKKTEAINHSMDRKEESIQRAGAQRDAVLVVTKFYQDLDETTIKVKIEYWYRYFMGLQSQPFV